MAHADGQIRARKELIRAPIYLIDIFGLWIDVLTVGLVFVLRHGAQIGCKLRPNELASGDVGLKSYDFAPRFVCLRSDRLGRNGVL